MAITRRWLTVSEAAAVASRLAGQPAPFALRLQVQGVSPWVVRVVLTYLRNDLVRAWKSSAAVALAINGLKGTLEPAFKPRPASAAAWVPLRDISKGIDAEIQRTCGASHTVWMWRKVSAHAVPRASA